jgi:hypothetical protein
MCQSSDSQSQKSLYLFLGSLLSVLMVDTRPQRKGEGGMITLPRFASPDPTQSRLSQPQVVFKNYHSNHRNEPSLSSVRLALRKASTYKSACSIRYSHPPETDFRTVVGAPTHNKPRLVSFVNQFCEPSVITSNTRHLLDISPKRPFNQHGNIVSVVLTITLPPNRR